MDEFFIVIDSGLLGFILSIVTNFKGNSVRSKSISHLSNRGFFRKIIASLFCLLGWNRSLLRQASMGYEAGLQIIAIIVKWLDHGNIVVYVGCIFCALAFSNKYLLGMQWNFILDLFLSFEVSSEILSELLFRLAVMSITVRIRIVTRGGWRHNLSFRSKKAKSWFRASMSLHLLEFLFT